MKISSLADVDHELINMLLRYEPDTGKLFWKERSVDFFEDGRQSAAHNCKAWNAKRAGREALTARNKSGYRHGSFLGKAIQAHRAAWLITYGYWPDQIDHINGNSLDNRITNLRDVNNQENQRNLCRFKNNKSGVAGVSWDSSRSRWVVNIRDENKINHLRRFDTLLDAVAARKSAEREHGYHVNHGRDPVEAAA